MGHSAKIIQTLYGLGSNEEKVISHKGTKFTGCYFVFFVSWWDNYSKLKRCPRQQD
jgi:hypothetical protein